MNSWRELKISGENLEEKAALLYEVLSPDLQICGSVFNSDGSCSCYYEGNLSDQIRKQILELDLEIVADLEVEAVNWTQSCPELLEVIEFERISIRPVLDIKQAQETEVDPERDILIIPGTGFGTGHHASTKNLIRMLHRPEIAELKPKKVLDAGSGSGILALVSVRLFGSHVDAYEVDTMACENAVDNVNINNMQQSVKIYDKSAHLAEGRYDLIIANLYAELLETLCFHLVSLANDKAIFLLSGIRSDLKPAIKERYESRGLETIEEKTEDGWSSLVLKKI